MLKKIVVSGVVFSKNNLVLLVAILIWDQNNKKIYVYICLVYYNIRSVCQHCPLSEG